MGGRCRAGRACVGGMHAFRHRHATHSISQIVNALCTFMRTLLDCLGSIEGMPSRKLGRFILILLDSFSLNRSTGMHRPRRAHREIGWSFQMTKLPLECV